MKNNFSTSEYSHVLALQPRGLEIMNFENISETVMVHNANERCEFYSTVNVYRDRSVDTLNYITSM